MRVSTAPPAAMAAAGAVCISSSAVLMALAATSASITALGRCAFALPVLGALTLIERRRGARPMPSRGRWLARLAGVFLAGDLVLWNHAIGAIGAGLGTVVTNLSVLIISLLAWLVLGERPGRSLVLASPVMLAGLVLVGGIGGVGGSRAYGSDPALGVADGMGVAFLSAIYILMLRQAASHRGAAGSRIAVADPLWQATLGATAGSAALGFALHDFHLGHAWPTLGWLALLAITSQVIGWLLITVSMPRLPAAMVGTLLLVQPAGSVGLSYLVLGERPSGWQLLGVALVLAGVLVAVGGRAGRSGRDRAGPPAPVAPRRGYRRESTRIIRQESAASTGESVAKSP